LKNYNMKHKLTVLVIFLAVLHVQLEAQWQITKSTRTSTGLDYAGFSQVYLPNGDYVLTGNVVDTIKLDSKTLLHPETNPSFFVAYLNSQDSIVWMERVRSNASNNQLSLNTPVKIGANRSILVAGQFTGSVSFPKGNNKSAGTLHDIFWLQFDTKGNFKSVGIYPDASLSAIEINANLEVVIAGRTMQNGNNAFVAKSDSFGKVTISNNYVFNGTKNNRDIITAVNFDAHNNILFAGKANSDSIGYGSHSKYIDAPNDINRYTLFLGKIAQDGALKWFKGAVPKPGSRPYQFDIKNINFHKNSSHIWMSGLFDGANFTIDTFTLATTSTVNSDARKPIILCLDSNGTVQWHSSLGLNGENQRGEIFTCIPYKSGFLLTAELAHYYFNTLNIGSLEYRFGDRGVAVIFMDSTGKIIDAFGTNPKEKMWASWIHSTSFHPNRGIALSMVNNQFDTLKWDPFLIKKGTYLLHANYCDVKGNIEAFNPVVCSNGTDIKLKGTNVYGKFYGEGIDVNGTIKISLLSPGLYPFRYEIIEPSGCQLGLHDSFRVVAPSKVIFSSIDSAVCLKDTFYTLSAVPTGGAFTGMGTNNTTFNPFLAKTGKHTIRYTVLDANNCSSSDSFEIRVKEESECAKQNSTYFNNISIKPFPNPFNDCLWIPPHNDASKRVSFYRIDGSFIKSMQHSNPEEAIIVTDLPLGPIIINISGSEISERFLFIHE